MTNKKRILSLNGLRFFFAVAVFFHHFDMLKDLNINMFDALYKYLFEGYIGVNFFFILSGFMVAYGYEKKLLTKQTTDGEFIFYRIARLWPLHIVTLVAASAIYGAFGTWFTPVFWVNVFMLQSFVPVDAMAFGYNGLAWCMSTEMFFYVAFCALIYLPRNKKIWLTGILSALSAIAIFHSSQFNNISWLIYINPLFRLIDFLVGMIICDYHIHRKNNYKNGKATWAELGTVALLAITMLVGCRQDGWWLWRYDLYYVIPLALMIYVFAAERGVISKMISCKALQYLGDISFEIYLVHQMVLYIVKTHMISALVSLKSIIPYTIIAFTITIIAASVLHFAIGEPTYRILRNTYSRIHKKI